MAFYPSWKTNLTIFLLATTLVAGYFFWQLHQASYQFKKQSHKHSKVFASVVEINVRNSLQTNRGMEEIADIFLQSSGKFVHYLDEVEPFNSDELNGYVEEAGLSGVKIIREESVVSGPENWLADIGCEFSGKLVSDQGYSHYMYVYDGLSAGCIILGFPAEKLLVARELLNIDNLLEKLASLEGIAYLKMEDHSAQAPINQGMATLKEVDGLTVSENYFVIGDKLLIVALKSEHFAKRILQMKREFAVFSAALFIFGLVSSYYLFRSQKLRVQQARDFEREIAKQHEEAALGRAAAIITHELKNPLNAIGIGLQRLQFEADTLDQEHQQLIKSMKEAVGRSDTIISRLKQYTRPFQLQLEILDVFKVVGEVLKLYETPLIGGGIEIENNLVGRCALTGESKLLGQLFENIIKNSLEAQPKGGYLKIDSGFQGESVLLSFTNKNYTLGADEAQKVMEPYFTTKTQGTGLGLPICKKIAEAHNGTIHSEIDLNNNSFTISVLMPTEVKERQCIS